MAANETALGDLHSAVARALADAILGQELPGYTDTETGEVVEAQKMPVSAAILTVAAKFLKDNNITCEPSSDNELGALEKTMRDRQNSMRGVDKTDRTSIMADTQFMGSA